MTTQPARPALTRGDPGTAAAKGLVATLAARDFRGLASLLAPDARMRYLVPRGPGELTGAADIAAKFHDWFGGRDAVDVDAVDASRVVERTAVRYRFRVRDADGRKLIEQQVHLDVDEDGRIARLDLLCSGFRLVEPATVAVGAAAGVHRFDAGDLGCADGLAAAFRQRLEAIPVGDALVVVARDPAAREDLPPLARMLGHAVRSVETSADGTTTTYTIERIR